MVKNLNELRSLVKKFGRDALVADIIKSLEKATKSDPPAEKQEG